MRYTCLDVRSPDVNFLRKVMSGSRHDGAAYSRHPCRQSADADIVSAFPLSFSTFLENINILRQTSSTWHRMLREFSVLKYKVPCYTFGFHDLGICNRTSFSYPQTFLSVGISGKTSFLYPQTFHSVGISNETSFSYPQTFHSVGISGKTSFSYP